MTHYCLIASRASFVHLRQIQIPQLHRPLFAYKIIFYIAADRFPILASHLAESRRHLIGLQPKDRGSSQKQYGQQEQCGDLPASMPSVCPEFPFPHEMPFFHNAAGSILITNGSIHSPPSAIDFDHRISLHCLHKPVDSTAKDKSLCIITQKLNLE